MQKRPREKKGIRRKVILIICSSTLIVLGIGIVLAYFLGFDALNNTAGNVNRKLSKLLASDVGAIFDEEMARVRAYTDKVSWREALVRSNSRYDAADEKAAAAGKGYLDNDIGAELSDLVEKDKNIAAIYLFDRFGGLVAASGRAAGFYRADERTSAGTAGKSGVSIGPVTFDEAVNVWIIPCIFWIKDADGNALGGLKADLAVRRLFASLENFRVDNTGHAVLVDGRGNVIFHPGPSRTNIPLLREEDYRRLLTGRQGYGAMMEPDFHPVKMFVAFSEVASSYLSENGLTWRVFIDQNASETFAPLNRSILWAEAAIVFLIIVTIPVGIIFSDMLVKPILELQKAATQIMNGNWDYKIEVRTGDEIEQFADVYREMVTTIKNKQEELLGAKGELEACSTGLERKVLERTNDLTVARDKLDKYAKELERALLVKSDFISMISHELRTPLAAVKVALDIISDENVGAVSGQQKEFLGTAKKNVDRLARLINNILDIQKLEEGKAELNISQNDINEVVKEAVRIMGPLAEEKKLELVADMKDDLPLIRFDRDKIIQVLTNLVNNSIKFTEKGGITIITDAGDNFIQVSVKDTGCGIQEEDISKLFKKFVQLETGFERKTGGSGLGLAITKDIVEKHKGKIWAESEFGRGTTFHFVLPIRERRAEPVGLVDRDPQQSPRVAAG